MESEASHSISFLPAELITEILSKLPVKSLLKFKRVSKSWLALISSPEFIKIHLNYNANNKEYTHHKVVMGVVKMLRYIPNCSFRHCSLSSLFNESCVRAKDMHYPFNYSYIRGCAIESSKKPRYDVSIVGSVNGLICLIIQNIQLFLWNPSIRKYKKLPNHLKAPPRVYWRAYGFGYDELHDDYKVIFFNEFTSFGSYDFMVKIYSLKSDSSRSLDNCPHLGQLSGKFVNGKLHWLTNVNSIHRLEATGVYLIPNIVTIDLADEKWGEIEQPCYGEGRIDSKLEVLGSDLSVIRNCNKTHVDVWVMKEYGVKESWTKMFTIKYPENPNFGKRYLHMTNEGEILVVIGSNFMIYNPKSDSFRYSKVIDSGVWDLEEIYVESLVCPLSKGWRRA